LLLRYEREIRAHLQPSSSDDDVIPPPIHINSQGNEPIVLPILILLLIRVFRMMTLTSSQKTGILIRVFRMMTLTSSQKTGILLKLHLLMRRHSLHHLLMMKEVMSTVIMTVLIVALYQCHVPDDVEHFGSSVNPLSAFPYENHLQSIKKLVKGPTNPIAQTFIVVRKWYRHMCQRDPLRVVQLPLETCKSLLNAGF